MNLSPFLLFEGNCAEAMAFYQSCLGGDLTITRVRRYADGGADAGRAAGKSGVRPAEKWCPSSSPPRTGYIARGNLNRATPSPCTSTAPTTPN